MYEVCIIVIALNMKGEGGGNLVKHASTVHQDWYKEERVKSKQTQSTIN